VDGGDDKRTGKRKRTTAALEMLKERKKGSSEFF
jgi:hypothetical protein